MALPSPGNRIAGTLASIVAWHVLREVVPPSPGPSRWFFDVWSRVYDQPLVQRLTYRPVHDAVVAALRGLQPRRILDVGCGTGLLTARLRRAFGEASVVGCDFSHGMLVHARAHDGSIAWLQGDACRLPVRDGAADVVVTTEAFHWFPDQPAALAEFFRVLVPGGHVLLALVNTPTEAVRTLFRAGSGMIGQPFDWPTREDMRTLCTAAGFRVVRQERLFRLPAGVFLPPVLTIAERPA
jgi:SAM-dependent methyltransferase